ncbi:MAG: 2-oxo acid dehydrogenase subunit E2 [Magnetococcales bacterium]|nr:2-oxo acid dehydrogenase subunit E2 [Magnetococcales bacterium]
MPTTILLPELGDNIKSGDVVRVVVNAGDTFKNGDPLLEVETDKAVIEVPASRDGTVTAVLVKAGDKIKAGDPILTIGEDAVSPAVPAAAAPLAPPPPPVAPPAAAPAPVPMPPATATAGAAAPPPAPPVTAATGATATGPIPASPAVRREARELGVDIRQVTGSGPHGRITLADVRQWVRSRNQEQAARPAGSGLSQHGPLPDFSRWGGVTRDKMSGIRRATAVNLTATWNTVPQVTGYDQADITNLEAWRKQLPPLTNGQRPTLTAFLVKIIAGALRRFPDFNSAVDMAAEEIVRKAYVHVGVAVDTPHGLLVPVIRDVDRKNIAQLAQELEELSQKARERKLALADMQGGCFTLSNLGGLGGLGFNPIINYPEVGILGVSRARLAPVHGPGGGFQPRLMLPLSLSYDHRLIDGAQGTRFLDWIRRALEQPMLALLEG